MASKPGIGQISDTDIRTLRIFKAVVECGGFSAAEVELNISRAAISIAMSDLETRLGFKLCQRGRSGFALTNEGTQVYSYTLQLISSIENFRTSVNALHANMKGELNIGITDNLVTIPHMIITQALSKLKERGPDIRINIRMIPPTLVEQKVLDGQLHVGIVPELRVISGLHYRPLYQEQSLLYCARNHPLYEMSQAELESVDLSEFDAVIPAYAQTAEIKAHHQMLKTGATATDREGIAFLIRTGKFIGYLPDHLAATWEDKGEFRPILPEKYRYLTTFSAVTRSSHIPNMIQDTFIELVDKLKQKSPADQ
ncbi:LysR family transcriptional regulator [Rhodanobacter aciditrophus]|uniref:LysR family transcriptional regulator n=1 Tax=Rhodanobacter aciditrophus TaxID=1623218 RepID=A0ABW4AX03_9GAMM